MMIGAAATAGYAWLTEPVLNRVFLDHDHTSLIVLPFLVMTLFIAKGVADYAEATLLGHVGQRIVADLQARVFSHLVRQDLTFFHGTPSGELVARLTSDANHLRAAVSTALTGLAKSVLTCVFLVAVMFYQDWALAAVSFFAFPLAVVPMAWIGRRVRRAARRTQESVGRFAAYLSEAIRGVRLIQAYVMEAHESARARALADDLFRRLTRSQRARALAGPIMEVLAGAAISVVIVYGGNQVIGGRTTPGAFFSFITALLLAYQPVKNLAGLNASLQEGLAAAERLYALLDRASLVRDPPGARALDITTGAVRFADVHFSYGPRSALAGIDLDLPAGRTTALVGPSGAGKSTIMNLIPRFYDVDQGRVTIDGQDVREVSLATLRGAIALVSQDVALFDDTVCANIAYGRPDAPMDTVRRAAESAAAHDFIMALPSGYDTVIGEGGVTLSGGQRQRLAIARAMLRDAPILLLDEATSSLDAESERLVQAALARLCRGRTVLVIAHRLSTVRAADTTVVIEGGRIIERGGHAELLARGGTYARLYARQLDDDSAPLAVATG
ncbi:MAG: ABC transporter ATP-binding protein [Alphaproteobacteria bacterium]|nr:ABC transporter ATP-binding protein [Alphaproteobacteria bacterium]